MTALAFQSPTGTMLRRGQASFDRPTRVTVPPTEVTDSEPDDDPRVRPTRTRDLVVARLRTLAKYGAAWDGDRAQAPSKEAISDAIDFVANLTMDVPFVVFPEPEGAIELAAQGSTSKVILVFEGNGKVSVFIRKPYLEPSHDEFDIPPFIGAGRKLESTLRAALT